jgi:hypothetical protein
MKTLSATPVATEYFANIGKECKLGKYVVTVKSYEKESQSGSWDRGFKWTYTTYGYLTRELKGTKYYKPTRYSPDNGVTWYESIGLMKKQRAGKVKLEVRKSQEFAFDGIQRINKSYDSNYRWHA